MRHTAQFQAPYPWRAVSLAHTNVLEVEALDLAMDGPDRGEGGLSINPDNGPPETWEVVSKALACRRLRP